ncbi:MAG TPA: hypothetical protein VJ948_02710 [Acidimicrobiia bacterium]|nr:hypothetical protein [Acidimicrobiia bacterium]
MRNRWRKRDCPHEHMLMVTSVGVRRSICETCGHISFQMTQPEARTARGRADLPKAAGL